MPALMCKTSARGDDHFPTITGSNPRTGSGFPLVARQMRIAAPIITIAELIIIARIEPA